MSFFRGGGIRSAEAPINSIQDFSQHLKENTKTSLQLVNSVWGNNACLHWELYEMHKYMSQLLKQAKKLPLGFEMLN